MSKLAIIAVAAVGIVVLLGALLIIPSNAGGQTPKYTCSLSISGTYVDTGISHSISNFQATFGSCHVQSILALSGIPYNIFAFSLTFGVTCIDASGINHCIGDTVHANVPALQTTYAFSGSTQISNIPSGSYSLVLTNSYLSTPYKVSVTVP